MKSKLGWGRGKYWHLIPQKAPSVIISSYSSTQPKTSSEKQARAGGLGGTPYTGREILAQRKKENDDNLLMIEQFPMEGRLLVVVCREICCCFVVCYQSQMVIGVG